jgi:DNA-directed RNA polymerase sigma subunit (sigma70/sigma32)
MTNVRYLELQAELEILRQRHRAELRIVYDKMREERLRLRVLRRVGKDEQSMALQERNQQMVTMRESGATYKEIGKTFGISGGRARQIVVIFRRDWRYKKSPGGG